MDGAKYKFENVYESYFNEVFRYAKSLTMDEPAAEELTEETFFRALRALPSFRGDCDIKVWLCRIAKNLWLTQQKKNARLHPGEDVLEQVPDTQDFAEELGDKQAALRIHRLLHGMDEPYKEVFSLRVFGELSFREIGELFEKSEHWACVTYHRAKQKILAKMGGKP